MDLVSSPFPNYESYTQSFPPWLHSLVQLPEVRATMHAMATEMIRAGMIEEVIDDTMSSMEVWKRSNYSNYSHDLNDSKNSNYLNDLRDLVVEKVRDIDRDTENENENENENVNVNVNKNEYED